MENFKQDTRAKFRAFADSLSGEPLICGHFDADGLTSAAILARAWERGKGVRPPVRVVGRAENVWDADFAGQLEGVELDGLIFADLGMRANRPRPDVPLCVLDHHVPGGVPDNTTMIHADGLDPAPSTALLAFYCAQGLVGEEAADDLLWLAAMGLVGDMAEDFPEVGEARKRYGITNIRKAVSLVNAPRRGASGDATPALELLLKSNSPKEVLSGEHPETATCLRAKEEVKAATAEARRAAPKFSPRFGSDVAFVRIDTPAQVHPVIAQSWAGRLKPAKTFVANMGYVPGRVHFSGRTKGEGSLVDWLAEHRPKGASPEHYGNGHPKAAGGALDVAVWNAWMKELGFEGMGV